ncbi:GlxA family transcriptional regulator [Limibacillus halophilus]|uniref:Transcriptional regulator GlxA family with amidase domain n=1 Tax=Limibacillus halophilus TaxID=1579333 RepID=A0A839STU7_9PROT|nr:GlxA family transcriptional regulator [Limibacillus halophilus]MBB3064395.1 transcriptional regulator GlxA family with amidase domain [Limibacillus halophilus]
MFGATPRETPQRIAFVMLPRFSMIAFTSAIEPLRVANRLSGQALYSWHLFSPDGKPVAASNGIALTPEGDLEAATGFGTVIVCSGIDVQKVIVKPLFAWLRKIDRKGVDIGSLCTGAHVLASAGLLDGHRCTIHWENLPAFAEDFPEIDVTAELFEIDRSRFTCAGGTAAIDLMLNVIAMQHGHELAAKVADQFMHERIRDRHDHQRMGLPARLGVRHPKLLKVIQFMEENLEEPLSRAELAREAGLSTRQLERLFRKYLTRSPARYYLELRLNKARLLLLQTNMSVIDVALACGFVSASHFSKCYRDYFGHTPRKERGVPLHEGGVSDDEDYDELPASSQRPGA